MFIFNYKYIKDIVMKITEDGHRLWDEKDINKILDDLEQGIQFQINDLFFHYKEIACDYLELLHDEEE